jgi:hypothetical protein
MPAIFFEQIPVFEKESYNQEVSQMGMSQNRDARNLFFLVKNKHVRASLF